MKKGLLIVYSGPSGVGKGTIMSRLLAMDDLKLKMSVSMTTRKPREGEIDGVSYFFVTKEDFEQAIEEGKLLEYASYVGNYYGTPLEYVDKMRNEGYNVVLEIEVQGAKQIIEKYDDILSVFISPPSMEELERRLKGRKTESDEVVQKRIDTARNELKEVENYRYNVCNDNIDAAVEEVRNIILKEME